MGPTYNSISLQTSKIITSDIDYHSGAKRKINLIPVAHGNHSIVTDVDAPSKTIRFQGLLEESSITAMDTLEDTFKGYFVGRNKNLDIPHGGGTRRYIVTPDTPDIQRPGGLNWGKYTLDFQCASPFGMDTSSTSLTSGSGVTSSTATWGITVGGSAEFQYPIITVTLVSGTQLTNQSMSIGNNQNGMVCTITRTWTGGDVVVIDPLSSTPVTVNGVEVVFTGSIPLFEIGSGSISYSDTFLTRSVSYGAIQYKYWI